MSGGVMLPHSVVAPLIQTLGPFGPQPVATTQGVGVVIHLSHLSSSDWRPVVS